MTMQLPERITLEMPSGDADAIADLARDIGAVARCLGDVDARISGPAADAPGWLGDDAAAAAVQVREVDTLIRAAHDAVGPAAERLAAHAERLLEARSRIRALRHEQDEQFAEAWSRLAVLPELDQLLSGAGSAAAQVIADDVEAGEAGRRRRHSALLEEIEDDAAATAPVLVDACAAVGGLGRRGDANRVVAYLAAELPGWGDRELIGQGRALAESFADLELPPERREELAREALPFASSPAFARALLLASGREGMRDTLRRLGDGIFGPTSSLAGLVALVLGTASRTGGGYDTVGAVLGAEYVPAVDSDPLHDLTALGMGTVLAASVALGTRGLDKSTVVEWGRQIAVRERQLRSGALERIDPMFREVAPVDPLPVVVAILADGRGPASAAAFLAVPGVWDVLLSRTWEDCGVSIGHLIRTAAEVPGVAGDAVVRDGLESLAAGLEDGDVHDWPVPRATADAVAPALADALALHISVAAEGLAGGVDGALAPADGCMLRGLGLLSVDRETAAVVEAALEQWVSVQHVPVWVSGPPPPLPAVVVPNAYLAVQEYGQKLLYALNDATLEKDAEDRAFLWNITVGLVAGLAPGPWGLAAGVVEGYVAMWLGFDGSWDANPDHGRTFRADVPDLRTLTELSPAEWAYVNAMADMAKDSFAGTTEALGPVHVHMPPVTHWWEPIQGMVSVGPGDLVDVAKHGRVHVPR